MEELLYRYNPWWEEKEFLTQTIHRQKSLERLVKYLHTKDIIFLTGLRRVGKTTLLKLLIKHLIENFSVKHTHIFYISLDDYILSSKNIIEIVDEFRKIHRLSIDQKVYLFFDEITYKKEFEIQLKNLYDYQNVKIFASSSSSSFLKNKKPYLTGRSKILEILPLDFSEFLLFKKIKITKSNNHLIESYFNDYLKIGGIPEYVLREDIEYLKELVDDIIFKDIAVFHNVKQTQILKDFFLLLMERSGKVVSINKIANILKISPDTARRYLDMFVETYLIYVIPRFGKTNERILSPKKLYSSDLGIRTLFTGFRDVGSLFENYVYLLIKHLSPCYYYKDGIELDFITDNNILIEVKYFQELTKLQRKLFDNVDAKKKIIITNIKELDMLNGIY